MVDMSRCLSTRTRATSKRVLVRYYQIYTDQWLPAIGQKVLLVARVGVASAVRCVDRKKMAFSFLMVAFFQE